jgi:hypothetical protein
VDETVLTDTPHVAILTWNRAGRWVWECTGCSRACHRTGGFHHRTALSALRCATDVHGDGPVIALDRLLGVYRADDQPVLP